MKNKKVIAFLMAVLMLVLATPALAEGTNTKTTIDATTLVPEIIVVTVPTDANVVINPYELPVEINHTSVTDQIITTPVSIWNQSAAPVNVSVKIGCKIKEGSDMILNSYSTTQVPTTSKRAFAYFEIQATNNPDSVAWDSGYDANKHLVVRDGRSKKNIITLDAGDENAPSSNKCYGAFRLTGDCVTNPKNEWTEQDGIDVVLTFSFALAPTT